LSAKQNGYQTHHARDESVNVIAEGYAELICVTTKAHLKNEVVLQGSVVHDANKQ
jgi:hypothetical protein